MLVTLLTASAAALVAVVPTYEFARYRWWRHWSKGAFLALLAALILTAVAFAMSVALVADSVRWTVFSGKGADATNGLVYGAAGVALLRVDVSAFYAGKAKAAVSVLWALVKFLEDALDTLADGRITDYVRQLDDDMLKDQAWYFFESFDRTDSEIPDLVKKADRGQLRTAAKNLGQAADQESRNYLRAFCVSRYKARQRIRPSG